MAADLEISSIIPTMVSTRRLEGTLVAPERRKDVPNHLTDTRIFGKTKANKTLQISPRSILFEGCEVRKTHQHTLRILNCSTINQPMHIIPPKTSFFTIKYSKKQSSLIPGLSISVVVEFKPVEWQYYYDCVRIHCQDEQNILVPIHAYPVVDTTSFPRYVTFDSTPIGHSQTKTIHLKCNFPVEFEYKLSYLRSNPAYSIEKMKGVIPANGEVGVDVVFSPTEFSTAIMELKLEVSQYNYSSKTCTFSGTSTPGLTLDHLKVSSGRHLQPPPVDATVTTKEQLPTPSKQRKLVKFSSKRSIPSKGKQEIYHEGIMFPTNLDTPSAVGKILLQEPGKLKASQIRKVMSQASTPTSADSGTSCALGARQLKQAAFLHAVEATAKEERANHLRWATRLGEMAMSSEEKDNIYLTREKAKNVYQELCHTSIPEEEYARIETVLSYHRTRRKANELPESQCPIPTFDPSSNNLFVRRHLALTRFVQAGRKVVVRLRCQRRLEKLQDVVADLKTGKSLRASLAHIYQKKPPVSSLVPLLPSSPHHIRPLSFPKYTGHTPSNIGGVNNLISDKPVEEKSFSIAHIKRETPFLDLKIPLQSDLLGYSPVVLPSLESYVSPGMPRELWSGAENEFENLSHIPGVDPAFQTTNAIVESIAMKSQQTEESALMEPSSKQSSASCSVPPTPSSATSRIKSVISSALASKKPSIIKSRVKSSSSAVNHTEVSEILHLVVDDLDDRDQTVAAVVLPPSLLQPPDADTIQILNPSPAVLNYLPPLPYSEATLDHALLPLPPYSTAKYPIVKPDPTEVLPVVMKWKQFPSPWLISTEAERKLASLWKPCLSDLCTTDLLSVHEEHPKLLSGVQQDDFVNKDSLEVLPVPTMKTVRTKFHIPDTEESPGPEASSTESDNKEEQHPIIRPQASKLFHEAHNELEKFRTDQFNQLGKRINKKQQSFLKLLDGSVDDT